MKPTSLRMVFVTASPVLTNEVKKYYTNLKEQLKLYLEKKQESKAAEETIDSSDDGIEIIDTNEIK